MLIAYDRDEAGEKAAEKLTAELAEMDIEVMRVVFPKGMDANEYALKVGPAAQSLGLVLRQAQWMAGVRKSSELRAAPVVASEPIEVEAPAPESAGEDEIPFLAAEPATTELVNAESVSREAETASEEEADEAEASEAAEEAGAPLPEAVRSEASSELGEAERAEPEPAPDTAAKASAAPHMTASEARG